MLRLDGAPFRPELALTPAQRSLGLMHRKRAPEDGMLFVFPEVAPHHFWMKDTMIPLDIIWLDASGKVVFVSANTPPCKADPCPTYGPDVSVRRVLEIAAGMAEKEKVEVGTVLELHDEVRVVDVFDPDGNRLQLVQQLRL